MDPPEAPHRTGQFVLNRKLLFETKRSTAPEPSSFGMPWNAFQFVQCFCFVGQQMLVDCFQQKLFCEMLVLGPRSSNRSVLELKPRIANQFIGDHIDLHIPSLGDAYGMLSYKGLQNPSVLPWGSLVGGPWVSLGGPLRFLGVCPLAALECPLRVLGILWFPSDKASVF